MPDSKTDFDAKVAAEKVAADLRAKKGKSPFEDAMSEGSGQRVINLLRFARAQQSEYHSALTTWRANRLKYAQEAQDVFKHRSTERLESQSHDEAGPKVIFKILNGSLNFVAGLAEFAAAQAEQDIFGGEPWFAAIPSKLKNAKLADTIQKHLQWTFRDGTLVSGYCDTITMTTCLGDAFTKTGYEIDIDEFEQEMIVLKVGSKPIVDGAGEYITSTDQARAWLKATPPAKRPAGKRSWGPVYIKKQTVMKHGVTTSLLNHNDIAFREDAPELDLKHTNFYNIIELPVHQAVKRFHLSPEDARRLAEVANVRSTEKKERPSTSDAPSQAALATNDEIYGDAEMEQVMNTRVRLIEGWMEIDPFGDGKARRIYIVFPPQSEEWLVYGDFLGNLSPNSELPIKCHTWERVPGKLYGRGFFAKYAGLQEFVDNLWNNVTYRNSMHANPITGMRTDLLERDDDDADIEVSPGLVLRLKNDANLKDAFQFLELPDLDQRSIELLQMALQMGQLRSGITSASQGDLSSVPENNTATGIRSLMSRAAVLLKKPVRHLRRSLGKDFGYAVRLTYANFDRDEAFLWGDGENAELLELKGAEIENLDLEVRMLLTQEQNQTKLEGAQVATDIFAKWLGVPEPEKPAARPLFLQAMKALEFDGAEQIIRKPMVVLEDVLTILPADQQQRLGALLQQEAQMPAALPPTPQAKPAPTPP